MRKDKDKERESKGKRKITLIYVYEQFTHPTSCVRHMLKRVDNASKLIVSAFAKKGYVELCSLYIVRGECLDIMKQVR